MVVSTEGGDLCLYQKIGRSCLKLVRPGDKVFLLLVTCGLVQFFGKLLVTVTDSRTLHCGGKFNSLVTNAHLGKPCKKVSTWCCVVG
jgi:hypothetical protein